MDKRLLHRALHASPAHFLWWRDDDAVADTPALQRLLALAERYQVPLTLAVIPGLLESSLVALVRGNPLVTVVPHGWQHVNHALAGKNSEYPAERPGAAVLRELQCGLARLQDAFGSQCCPVFVPPWNRFSPVHLPLLSQAGLAGLSTFGCPVAGNDVPAQIDILRWHPKPPAFAGERFLQDALLLNISKHLQTGILSHHLTHDAATWEWLDRLLTALPNRHWTSLPCLLQQALHK